MIAAVAMAAVNTLPHPAIDVNFPTFPRIPIIPPRINPNVIGSPINPNFFSIDFGFNLTLFNPNRFKIGSITIAKIAGSTLCIAMIVQFG